MAATYVGAGILVSRLAGLLRVHLVSKYFGQETDAVDAFNAAFRIPNLLQNLFGEGALSRLADVGIQLELKGTLKVDSDKLGGLLASDLASVSGFFAGVDTGEGLADKLGSTLEAVLKDGGALDAVSKGVEARIKALGERSTRMEESIAATIERYRKQFTQLDLMLSEMNATTSYLTQQFDALNAQLNG